MANPLGSAHLKGWKDEILHKRLDSLGWTRCMYRSGSKTQLLRKMFWSIFEKMWFFKLNCSKNGYRQSKKIHFERNRMLNFLIAIGVCLIFSIFDYIGFNYSRDKNLTTYRVVQYIVQIALTYFVWTIFSWQSAIAWLLLWWTFLCDFMYYGIAWLVNPSGTWEGRSQLLQSLNGVSWAWWTPYGLFINGLKNKARIIPLKILLIQGGIGFVVALFVSWIL